MKTRILGVIALVLIAVGNSSLAASIVDTGTIGISDGAIGTRARAGQFTLTSQTIITGLERYTAVTATNNGRAAFSIYTNVGNLPGVAIAGQSVEIAVVQGGAAWLVASGLNWNLGPGDYWLVFEGLFGTAAGPPNFAAPSCAPDQNGNFNPACITSPLKREAGLDSINPDRWSERGGRSGWRINGSSVPEPGTLALLGLGLAGLGLSRRRKTN